MTDPHPIMVEVLRSNSFIGDADTVESEVTMLPDQTNFGPGSCAVLAASNTPLERDFGIVRGLDPAEYAEEYPDWEERMQLNDHVLCEHFSRMDQELTHGWYHRLKLLPMPKYRYKEARRWLKNGFPDEPPDWTHRIYEKYTDQLASVAPLKVPKAATCPMCKSRQVNMVVVHTVRFEARAGVVRHQNDEGQEHDLWVSINEPDKTEKNQVTLVCQNCGAPAVLDDDDRWDLPGITS